MGMVDQVMLSEARRVARDKKLPVIKVLRDKLNMEGTTLYHQTKDPWYVMEFLGHTSLQHTRKYVILEKALFHNKSDDFFCKVAKTSDESIELIELGFEFVNEINGAFLYRKRK